MSKRPNTVKARFNPNGFKIVEVMTKGDKMQGENRTNEEIALGIVYGKSDKDGVPLIDLTEHEQIKSIKSALDAKDTEIAELRKERDTFRDMASVPWQNVRDERDRLQALLSEAVVALKIIANPSVAGNRLAELYEKVATEALAKIEGATPTEKKEGV